MGPKKSAEVKFFHQSIFLGAPNVTNDVGIFKDPSGWTPLMGRRDKSYSITAYIDSLTASVSRKGGRRILYYLMEVIQFANKKKRELSRLVVEN